MKGLFSVALANLHGYVDSLQLRCNGPLQKGNQEVTRFLKFFI